MGRRWPGFSASDVLRVHAFRAAYAAPLVAVGHLDRMAPVQSHIEGLTVATTAQIYPQDRGMSEGVRIGGQAAGAVLAPALPSDDSRSPGNSPRKTRGIAWRTAWVCPLCGGTQARRR